MSRPWKAQPPAAAEQHTVHSSLHDGAVVALRPLRFGETAPLLAVFEQMSSDSRALRYLTGLTRLPGPMVTTLSAVDGERHVAWLASLADEPVGIGRYVLAPGSRATAELALEVVDRHQGRGLGTVLLDVVTTVAAARGVRRVTGTTAAWNSPARRLLERVGVMAPPEGGYVDAEAPLRLLATPVVDRAAVLALACDGSIDRALDIG